MQKAPNSIAVDRLPPAAAASYSSASRPIDNIPPELLIDILRLALEDDVFYYKGLHRLAQVCKVWYNLILSLPSFWRYVTSKSVTLSRLAIIKSANLPLIVRTAYYSRARYNGFMAMIGPEMPRWESVILYLPDGTTCNSVFGSLSLNSAPKLKDLRIAYSGPFFPPVVDPMWTGSDLFKGQTPELRTLSLRGLPMPWGSKALSGLESLVLEDLSGYAPRLSQLLAILEACAGLTTLHLRNALITNDNPPPKDIYLNRLKNAYLQISDAPYMSYLLRHIVAPESATIECKFIVSPLDHHGWFNEVVAEAIVKCQDLKIYYTFSPLCSLKIHNGCRTVVYGASADTKSVWEGLRDMAKKTTPHLPLKSLTVGEVPLLNLVPFFARLPHLERLSSTGSWPCVSLADLSTMQDIDGVQQWLLPELTHLDVDALYTVGSDVLKLVEARCQQNTNDDRTVPKRLEMLRMVSQTMSEGDAEHIKAVLEKEGIQWRCK